MSAGRDETCCEDLIDCCCCCCPRPVKIFLAWCCCGCEDPNSPTPYRNPDRHITCYVRRSAARDLMSADTRFLDQVKDQMRTMENTRLDIKDWEDPSRNMTAPSIVICAAASRVGSDVDHALRGIEYDKNTVILIFHPLASHVRVPGRTEDTLLDDKYRALGAMIDVLYTGHEGPYKCPTNNEAIHRLSSFLRKRGAGPSETSSLTY